MARENAVNGVRERFSSATEGLSSVASGVLDRIQGAWGRVKDVAGGLASGLKQALGRTLGAVAGAVAGIKEGLTTLDPAAISGAWGTLTGLIGGAWQGLQAGGAALKARLGSLWTGLRRASPAAWRGSPTAAARWSTACATRRRAWPAGSAPCGRVSTSRASGLTAEGGGLISRAISAVVSRIVSAGQQVWGGIQSRWQALRERTGGWLSGVADRARGVWEGVKSRAAGV